MSRTGLVSQHLFATSSYDPETESAHILMKVNIQTMTTILTNPETQTKTLKQPT